MYRHRIYIPNQFKLPAYDNNTHTPVHNWSNEFMPVYHSIVTHHLKVGDASDDMTQQDKVSSLRNKGSLLTLFLIDFVIFLIFHLTKLSKNLIILMNQKISSN